MSALMKPGLSDPKNIVIFRALQLGDMLHAVPAMRTLRASFPRAHITLVSLPWASVFVERFHSYLDDFISFPGYPGLPEQVVEPGRIPSFLYKMQALSFNLALQMQGAGDIANPLICLWGAKRNAGFYRPGEFCPDKDYFLEYPDHELEVWRHLRLMQFLGLPLQGDELEFPLFEEDWEALASIQRNYGLAEDYVCIHPGARRSERRWPTSRFAEVGDGLAAQGLQVVLTGSRDEADLTAQLASKMTAPAIDLGGRTSLGALGALFSKARLLVTNDTGVSHLASALKTPSVVLFAVADFDRWAPLDSRLHTVLSDSLSRSAQEVLLQAETHLKEVYTHAC